MPTYSGMSSIEGLSSIGDPVTVADEVWTLVMVPDTQHLSFYGNNLDNLFQYVVDEAPSRNIKMMMHMGDIVAGFGDQNNQWTKADLAFDVWKNSGIPFLANIGNHDFENSSYQSNRLATDYKALMDLSWHQGQDWFIDDTYDGMTNTASKITVGNYTYLFVSVEHLPRAAAVTWVTDLIDVHYSDVDYIFLSVHMLLLGNGTRTTNPAVVALWDAVKDYDKLRLTLSGHVYDGDDPAKARRTDDGIHQHCLNYQNETGSNYDASGVVRFYTIDQSDHSVTVDTWNGILNTEYTDSDNKFTFNL